MAPLSFVAPRTVREELLLRYPGLNDNGAYWRMLGHLLDPISVDEDSHKPMASAEVVGRIAGEPAHRVKNRNFRRGEFLDDFRRAVLPSLETSLWDSRKRRASIVVDDGLDPDVHTLWGEQIGEVIKQRDELVYLETGKPVNSRARAAERRRLKEYLENHTAAETEWIMRYHNDLDPQIFQKHVAKHLADAWEFVNNMPVGDVRTQAYSGLLRIVHEPKPYLKAVLRSDRLYSPQMGLQGIKREVRSILTRGWHLYDLKSVQIAVAAKLWNIEPLQEFLADGGLFWSYLAEAFWWPLETCKEKLKKPIYALVYGAAWHAVRWKLAKDTNDWDIATTFMHLPLVDALYRAREERIELALKQGYLETTNGLKVPVADEDSARHALAREAQAMEVELIKPVYELLERENTRRFRVNLYLFDGVVVSYEHPTAISKWEAKIKEAVRSNAQGLGIHTELTGGLIT